MKSVVPNRVIDQEWLNTKVITLLVIIGAYELMILYIAIDGDDVGKKLEYYTVTNQMHELSNFFRNYQKSMFWMEEQLQRELNASIIINGGDSILVACDKEKLEVARKLEDLRNEFATKSQATLSIGIGNNPRQSYFALKFAKASGKDRIEIFEEY